MSIGSLMLDLDGLTLTAVERDLLRHPAIGGVILFARNFHAPEQLRQLTAEIHRVRQPPLLIAVDQEGGRVQRFRDGLSRLPPAAWYGAIYRQQPRHACYLCELGGWLMAAELRCAGVDFSFAPVLDLDRGISTVIGDRAFAAAPHAVATLAQSWMRGVHAAGMAAVGKHFPGHGAVTADSHQELPVDPRPLGELRMEDLVPFERLIEAGLEGIMPAHVRYPQIDAHPAGFSPHWLKTILRGQLDFQGMIFSDDLSMGATVSVGNYAERAHAALAAGCDMVLACNNRTGALEVVEALTGHQDPASQLRGLRLRGRAAPTREALHLNPRWHEAVKALTPIDQTPDWDLKPGY